MWPNPQETVDLVTFTEEILNGKLHFLSRACKRFAHFFGFFIQLIHFMPLIFLYISWKHIKQIFSDVYRVYKRPEMSGIKWVNYKNCKLAILFTSTKIPKKSEISKHQVPPRWNYDWSSKTKLAQCQSII